MTVEETPMVPQYLIELYELPEGWLCEIRARDTTTKTGDRKEVSASGKDAGTALEAAIEAWQNTAPARYPRPEQDALYQLKDRPDVRATVVEVGLGSARIAITTDRGPEGIATVTAAQLHERWDRVDEDNPDD